jgi:esterase/lipase superfamily enzyme
LHEVAHRRADARLGEIVLLAPDMDFEIFRRALPRIRPIADGFTVYVTSGDRPLALSAQLHGYPRLGQTANDVSTLAGVEIVDLSALDVEDPTGHLYHLLSADLGADLDRLLNNGERATDRHGLTRIAENLWRLRSGPDGAPD